MPYSAVSHGKGVFDPVFIQLHLLPPRFVFTELQIRGAEFIDDRSAAIPAVPCFLCFFA